MPTLVIVERPQFERLMPENMEGQLVKTERNGRLFLERIEQIQSRAMNPKRVSICSLIQPLCETSLRVFETTQRRQGGPG